MSPTHRDVTSTLLVNRDPYEVADFETAISATGFGKFNYILLLVALIGSLSSSFATTTMSYVVPVAECDLALTLVDKGMLNASYYLGTLSSVFLWGFLADTYGRRKLQICGHWLDMICNICCALSQTFWMLFIFKFFSGFIGSGPYTILMSYIAEFHCTKHRSRVMVLAGVFLTAGNAVLPFIAWLILPMDITFRIFNLNINSWRIFLALCALPSLIAAIGHTILPESPKFLMYIGRNKEALNVFHRIYEQNTGNLCETYPIKALVNERYPLKENMNEKSFKDEVETKANTKAFRNGLKQVKTMFFPPYLMNFILVNVLQFGGMMGSNTLRLWLPQLFATIDEYGQSNNYTSDASLCEMLAFTGMRNVSVEHIVMEQCTLVHIDDQVYINSVIVSLCAVLGYIFVGTLINAIGKKNLLVVTFAIAGIFGIANYWSNSSWATLTFSSIFVTLGGICVQVLIAVMVELFPTSLRTMVISMTMIFGRIGAMTGNILFPALLEVSCLPPFLLIGGITIGCALVSMLLPKKAADFT
ncbi:uncharacterized protein CBL_14519 [Carabus blaptoides fortunei]